MSLLLDVLMWCVGNREIIKAWEGGWIPGTARAPKPRPGSSVNQELLVADCIDHNRREWRVSLVNETFVKKDRKLILQIPLSIFPSTDTQFWSSTKDSIYVVKSGY